MCPGYQVVQCDSIGNQRALRRRSSAAAIAAVVHCIDRRAREGLAQGRDCPRNVFGIPAEVEDGAMAAAVVGGGVVGGGAVGGDYDPCVIAVQDECGNVGIPPRVVVDIGALG